MTNMLTKPDRMVGLKTKEQARYFKVCRQVLSTCFPWALWGSAKRLEVTYMEAENAGRQTAVRLATLLCVYSFSGLIAGEDYSPNLDAYPDRVYWGDTHQHTRNSADAYTYGNNLSPDDAFRYAQGAEITAQNGMRAKIKKPLDFLVVADHAEYLGGFYAFGTGDPRVLETAIGKKWSAWKKAGEEDKIYPSFTRSYLEPIKYPAFPEKVKKTIWESVAQVADEHYAPGIFTTFSGYEWTSILERNNLHRVVIFKDSADKVAQIVPFSAQDGLDPRGLWKALEAYELKTGGEVLAIPHNSNLSNGMMFSDRTIDAQPIGLDYARMSSRWEPLAEVTQVKGDSETHPLMSPDDEFADFETFDTNLSLDETEKWMLKHEYLRGALKQGLRHQKALNVNPYKFGLIGSTDGHNSLVTPEEDNFFGKFVESEPGPNRTKTKLAGGRLWDNWRISASGYAAVWADENTRDALFAAMKRKEVYATTGSRIRVRFFGGWNFNSETITQPNYELLGYQLGVPMGGDLTISRNNNPPGFLFSAAKDPSGANLDRVQIIKGWLDESGELHEKVYDVLWAGSRVIDHKTGKLPAVGSTVNLDTATFDNTIGADQLSGFWVDPDFDPLEASFYYCRVIEIPKPRWTLKDAVFFNLDLPDDIPTVVQDRAYTSPIWYTP